MALLKSMKEKRKFSDNLCDKGIPASHDKRPQITVTIDAGNEERLFVLVNFTRRGKQSKIVDEALESFFKRKDVADDLLKGYEKWQKENP